MAQEDQAQERRAPHGLAGFEALVVELFVVHSSELEEVLWTAAAETLVVQTCRLRIRPLAPLE